MDKDWAGRGLGADMLADALRRVAAASRSIGIAAVLVQVQVQDERAKNFYLACAEWVAFPADSGMLFLPIETVVGAFG